MRTIILNGEVFLQIGETVHEMPFCAEFNIHYDSDEASRSALDHSKESDPDDSKSLTLKRRRGLILKNPYVLISS